MKIKRLPSDFQVEELINLNILSKGNYAVYQVQKEIITTSCPIDYLSKWMKKSLKLFSHAGIKDKYAQTTQYISLKGDGPEMITTESFIAKRIGYSAEAIKSRHLIGNYFPMAIRDLSSKEMVKFKRNVQRISKFGFLNYFDDQRFRSQRSVQNAFGFYLFRKEFEEALKIYVNEVLTFNKKINSELAVKIMEHWTDWPTMAELKLPGQVNLIFNYLKNHPKDFQGAIFKMDYFDLRMMISAAQSFLWNEILTSLLKDKFPDNLRIENGAWQFYFFILKYTQEISTILENLCIEIPNANWNSPIPEIKNCLQKILTQYKLQLTDLQLPGIKNIFAENYSRKTRVVPKKFEFTKPEKDELYPNKYKMKLSFELPPGSYATMSIKQLFC